MNDGAKALRLLTYEWQLAQLVPQAVAECVHSNGGDSQDDDDAGDRGEVPGHKVVVEKLA